MECDCTDGSCPRGATGFTHAFGIFLDSMSAWLFPWVFPDNFRIWIKIIPKSHPTPHSGWITTVLWNCLGCDFGCSGGKALCPVQGAGALCSFQDLCVRHDPRRPLLAAVTGRPRGIRHWVRRLFPGHPPQRWDTWAQQQQLWPLQRQPRSHSQSHTCATVPHLKPL